MTERMVRHIPARKVPRYNVVSLRISDEEREDLKRLTEGTRKSVSTVMREALESHLAALKTGFHI